MNFKTQATGDGQEAERGSLQKFSLPGLAPRASRLAFTLIELMIVIGLVALIMAIGIPAFVRAQHKGPFRQSVSELKEVFARARAQAILSGNTVTLRIHPLDAVFEAPPVASAGNRGTISGEAARPLSVTLPVEVNIELLDVNLQPFKDAEETGVRFFPNGTCDLFMMILRSTDGEYACFDLEITTSLAEVEYDLQKFRQKFARLGK
ncbi:MAG: prepilin-type N-terminal cleavage/methylation domain-containing protein [Verrucomicrobia bacterium]|nr:prepilin-type N-terminal cleavage/methylation domain-containing protein [Verrucomicrobiota bacterium]